MWQSPYTYKKERHRHWKKNDFSGDTNVLKVIQGVLLRPFRSYSMTVIRPRSPHNHKWTRIRQESNWRLILSDRSRMMVWKHGNKKSKCLRISKRKQTQCLRSNRLLHGWGISSNLNVHDKVFVVAVAICVRGYNFKSNFISLYVITLLLFMYFIRGKKSFAVMHILFATTKMSSLKRPETRSGEPWS